MTAAEHFVQARPRLLRLAYSELGDVGEAEDVVQEAWLRLKRADAEAIENLEGWLTTVVARLALDRLGSARARRETYVGPWLPEPLVSDDPADRVTLDESVSYARKSWPEPRARTNRRCIASCACSRQSESSTRSSPARSA